MGRHGGNLLQSCGNALPDLDPIDPEKGGKGLLQPAEASAMGASVAARFTPCSHGTHGQNTRLLRPLARSSDSSPSHHEQQFRFHHRTQQQQMTRHGSDDLSEASKSTLRALGIPMDRHESPMEGPKCPMNQLLYGSYPAVLGSNDRTPVSRRKFRDTRPSEGNRAPWKTHEVTRFRNFVTGFRQRNRVPATLREISETLLGFSDTW